MLAWTRMHAVYAAIGLGSLLLGHGANAGCFSGDANDPWKYGRPVGETCFASPNNPGNDQQWALNCCNQNVPSIGCASTDPDFNSVVNECVAQYGNATQRYIDSSTELKFYKITGGVVSQYPVSGTDPIGAPSTATYRVSGGNLAYSPYPWPAPAPSAQSNHAPYFTAQLSGNGTSGYTLTVTTSNLACGLHALGTITVKDSSGRSATLSVQGRIMCNGPS